MKILITGGSGTIGSAFIRKYYVNNQFAIIGRNETTQSALKSKFPAVDCYLGNIENREQVFAIYDKFRPDVVIHAAALKHINLAEKQPIQTCYVNVCGSLNMIAASQHYQIPITIGVSSDKALQSRSVYGVSKHLMERCFLEASSGSTKFALCRLANIANSNGSVLPFWRNLAEKKQPLPITDPNMNRLMLSADTAAELIYKSIDLCRLRHGFTLTKLFKNVNMLELANVISNQYKIVGLRAGEQLGEDLISAEELPHTLLDGDFVIIDQTIHTGELTTPYGTEQAVNMTEDELRELTTASLN